MKINRLWSVILCLSAANAAWAGSAAVEHLKGHAEQQLANSADWNPLDVGDRITEGTAIRTDEGSNLDLATDQGHKLHVGPSTTIRLSALQDNKTKAYLVKGKVLSKVVPLKTQEQFLIQTPSAVCAVRGTEFWTGTNEKGTQVEVHHGIVGMQVPGTHTELAVHAGETASILKDGNVVPPHVTAAKAGAESPLAHAARHEVGLDMTRNQVMAAAAAEIRLAEYREGKSLIDVHGNRVRLEEYVVRPQPNQFKFVVLDQRDEKLDYFFYSGTFNQTLPTDLSLALKDINGKFGTTAPDYYLTAYEMGQSNTQDSIHDTGTGGHLVNISIDNSGNYVLTDPSDPTNTHTVPIAKPSINNSVTTYEVYNPFSDTYTSGVTSSELSAASKLSMYIPEQNAFKDLAAGDTFWKTRFNSFSHQINDISKMTYTPSGATNVLTSKLDAFTTIAGGFYIDSLTADANKVDATITRTYGDGTWEKYRTVLIDNQGGIAPVSAFAGVSSGAEYKNELLKWNYEQEASASEFQGRKIDLVVEPKIFIETGLIQ
jgi:hypothetical protein